MIDNTRSSDETSSLPPISVLFNESWQTFTQSVLSIFMLNVLGIIIYIGLAIIAVLFFILSGVGSFLLKNGPLGIATTLPSVPSSTIVILVAIAAILGLICLIVGLALQIASILLLDSKGKTPLGSAIKRSFGLILPLFLVNILVSILTFGAFFVFILPAILFYFLLAFVQFEVILNNQRWFGAIRRSVFVVSKNFGAILIRLIVIALIYIAIAVIAPNLLNRIGPEIQFFVGIISFLINLLLGWYMLAYHITLYKQSLQVKQVQIGLETETEKSITWIWVISIIGWLIAAGIFFMSYKVVSSGVLQDVLKNSAISPGESIQRSIDEMNPEAKKHFDRSLELFKQMREISSSGKTDTEIIADTKKINDENILELEKALDLEPNNPRIWHTLGNAYTWVSSIGNFEDGLAAFKKAEELDPDNVVYINGVGDFLIRMGKYEEAVLHFQKTLRLTNKSGFANLSVAQAYSNLKIYDLAREHYQKAIEIFTSENQDGDYDIYLLQARKELSNLPK
ncbi:tetratricopeptide repeat protein [Patescibacteria group bacterium]|nr:tetratricopeptide repeat protein [Patescibacteria group bacterium]